MEKIKIGLATLGCDKNRVDAEKLLSLALKIPQLELTNDLTYAEIVIINTCGFIKSAVKESLDTIFNIHNTIKDREHLLIVSGCMSHRYYDDLKKELLEADYILNLNDYDKFYSIIKSYIDNKFNTENNIEHIDNVIDNQIKRNTNNKKIDLKTDLSNDYNASVDKYYASNIKTLKDLDNITNNTTNNTKNATDSYNANNNIDIKTLKDLDNTSHRILTTPYHYAYLKIADGCNNHCSYCSIPSIRGNYRSISIDKLCDEAQLLIDNYNIKELNIVAQDVTRYGRDLYNEYALFKLLDALSALDIEWIRLNYCYPELISPNFINYIDNNPKICNYIDIPMQHISDKILKSMNRRSDKKSLYDLIDRLRQANNYMSIRSTFIIGYPDETDSDFNELIEFLKYADMDNVGFFSYSREEGTKAALMANQIKERVKKERLKMALAAESDIMTRKLDKLINTTQYVLCEGIDINKNMFIGRNQYNAPQVDKKIYFTSDSNVTQGEFYKVLVKKRNKLDLIGTIE